MSGMQIAEFPFEETQQRVDLLRNVLPRLGRDLMAVQQELNIAHSESDRTDMELMARADRFIEKELLGVIRSEFFEDGIRSEEEGELGEGGVFQWWIDPVDGTRNFIHGLPHFCITAGLCYRNEPVAGIVHVPAMDQLYSAIKGNGAYCNGESIFVSRVPSMRRALISSGLPYKREDIINSIMANISAFVASGAGLRRTGSLSLDLCWIADGKFDALWEREVHPWDVCGPAVILKEAGGTISDFTGRSFHIQIPEIIAANELLHTEVIEILRRASGLQGMN